MKLNEFKTIDQKTKEKEFVGGLVLEKVKLVAGV